MDPEFKIGDTIQFHRVKGDDFEIITGEVVELPARQRHLTHLVCVKVDAEWGTGQKPEYKMFKRADMIAPLVLILGGV